MSPERGHTLCAGLRGRNALQDFRRATSYGNLQVKCRRPEPRTKLCEPAQSKCMWRFQNSNFTQKFTGKMLQTRMSPERGHTLCARVRSRNACQHFRSATLCGNLQEKCRARKPRRRLVWASAVETHVKISQEPLYAEIYRKKVRTGLYSCRKNSLVWTHCLGKKPRFLVVQLYVPHASPCFPMFFSQVPPGARARCRRCRWQCRRRRLRHRRSGGSCRHARRHSHRRRSCRSGCPAEGDAAWTHHGINGGLMGWTGVPSLGLSHG